MILLKQTRNVKYKSFLTPGTQVEYVVQAKTVEKNVSSFNGSGVSGNQTIVDARFELRHFNLADENPDLDAVDAGIIEHMKKRWELLR